MKNHSERRRSTYDKLRSIFVDIIVNKVIYLTIYVEHCFKFSILSNKR